jgi:hypothetical protein
MTMTSMFARPLPKSRWLTLLAIALHVGVAGTASAQESSARRDVKETPLGQVDLSEYDAKKPTFWVSPDGRHAAYLTEKGIVIDGKASPDYAFGVKPESFAFSPDSQRTAYTAITLREHRDEVLVLDGVEGEKGYSSIGAGPVFSPDSKHVGMIARLSASSFDQVPVIDGREGEPHEDYSWESTFSADSKRFIYGVKIGDNYVMREDSVDGSEPRVEHAHGPATLRGNLFFGPNGQLGYIASTPDHKHFLVYDGQEDPNRYEEIQYIRVSGNGKHVAYVAEPQSFRHVVVALGKPGKVYDDLDVDSLEISPDGQHWGYVIEEGRKWCVVLDGKEQKKYDGVSSPVYSPDSQRVAYLAVANGKLLSVVNGKEGKAYDDRDLPVFSPDSKSAAFLAKQGERSFIVFNGQKQPEYDDLGTPKFSPDSQRLAYLAQKNGRWMMAEPGKEGELYDDIKGTFYFSDDSRHVAMVAYDNQRQLVVINGVEGNRYDEIITLGGVAKLHFDDGGSIHYLARKGNDLFLVDETLAE